MILGLVWLLLTRTKDRPDHARHPDRPHTARAFGINVDRVYAGTFALGCRAAAIAAVLVVPIQQAHYLMGGDPLLLSFIVVIIGGLGRCVAHWLPALIIGLLDGLLSTAFFFPPTFAKIVATLLVALVLVFRPQGLFGKRPA
jgi:branched-chain amino acid transport system permease protein